MRRLTENTKVEIFTLVLYQGVTITDCAARYGLSRGYLSRVVNAFRREYQIAAGQDIQVLIRELEPKCWAALTAAITDESNVYRSAAIALKVLQNTGAFKS